MKTLYNRVKRTNDRVVRCYLTLNCNSNCYYCSAGINKISHLRKAAYIPAEVWAEGLNRRKRHTILAGGEPFLYPEFGKLISLLNNDFKVEIYTNLGVDVHNFLINAKRKFPFLVSLHNSVKDFESWYRELAKLIDAGHSVRCHVVKEGNWKERVNFLKERGLKVTLCDNQNSSIISNGIEINRNFPKVKCTMQAFFFAPDGYRYNCVFQMGKGLEKYRFEHISENDKEDLFSVECNDFGYCSGCNSQTQGNIVYEK